MPTLLPPFTAAPERARLPHPSRAERDVLTRLAPTVQAALDWRRVTDQARPWVQAVRDQPAPFWALESLLREYPISSAEGLALMRLAEALLRVPDTETAIALTADQLGHADFSDHHGGHHPLLAGLSAQAIALSKKFLPSDGDSGAGGLIQRLGAQAVVAATVRAIQLLGRQFVLGRSIEEALREADEQRREQAALCFSYDMLGEGARTVAATTACAPRRWITAPAPPSASPGRNFFDSAIACADKPASSGWCPPWRSLKSA